MATSKEISADFPFKSNYVEVHGSKMHYVDEGSGDPILFLHGNPTYSYIWRNIIPHLTSLGRCIAPDLIGMGKSDKPNLRYRFFDHVKYVEGFIEKLGLENITLVIHDWGSGLGFHYAMRHENNIKGIAFMEAQLFPKTWKKLPGSPKLKMVYKMVRTPGIGWFMLNVMNMFITQLLPKLVFRKLSAEEKDYYAAPYKTVRSRKAIRQFPCEIPIDGKPADVCEMLLNYNQKLQESEIAKLLFVAKPGFIFDDKEFEWCKKNLKNLKVVDIGEGYHMVQEDNPHLIGSELANWYKNLL